MPPIEDASQLLKRCVGCCKQRPTLDYAGDSNICRECMASRAFLSKHRAATQSVRQDILKLAQTSRQKASELPTLAQLVAEVDAVAKEHGFTGSTRLAAQVMVEILSSETVSGREKLKAYGKYADGLQQTEAMSRQALNFDGLGDKELDERFADLTMQLIRRNPSIVLAAVNDDRELASQLHSDLTGLLARPATLPAARLSSEVHLESEEAFGGDSE